MLLVGGRPHGAQEHFVKALRRSPGNGEIAMYLAMAKGHTGKGELVLEGKGRVKLCGQPVQAPAKVKLPAGPYIIESNGTRTEVTVPPNARVRYPVPDGPK